MGWKLEDYFPFWDGTFSGAMCVKLPGCSWNMLKIHLCSVQLLSHTLEQCSLQAFQSLVKTRRIGREISPGAGQTKYYALERLKQHLQTTRSCHHVSTQYPSMGDSPYINFAGDQPTILSRCASFSSPGWCAKARFRQQSNRKRRSQTASPLGF